MFISLGCLVFSKPKRNKLRKCKREISFVQPNTKHILLIKIAFAFWLAGRQADSDADADAGAAAAPVAAGFQLAASPSPSSSLYAHFISGTLTHCAQYKKLSATDFVACVFFCLRFVLLLSCCYCCCWYSPQPAASVSATTAGSPKDTFVFGIRYLLITKVCGL